ncbi:methyl-accepting chemotaxis protein [Domibacillus indicus]|uniref:methyl-accepting chemotaxis protein n=1 Tax=Domibacillus indicus TaxID=1437523 RepID=UPI000617F085|nr:HAMP domain-containing methyl-accepting chemotaxis protein [Domibacillus indicus]
MRHLKVSQKMAVLLSTALLLLLAVSGISFSFLSQLAKQSEEMYENKLLSIQTLGQIRTNNRAIDSYTLEYMVTENPETNEELWSSTKETIDESNQLMEEYQDIIQNDPEEVRLAEPFLAEFGTFVQKTTEAQLLAGQNKNAEAYTLYLTEVKKSRQTMTDLGRKLTEYNQETAAELNKENQAEAARANIILLFIAALSLVIFTVLGILITRMITKPLREVQSLMSQAEKGNLLVTGTYSSRDELGQLTHSFNEMTSGLRSVIKQVSETAEQVAASSEELNANSEETKRATELIASTMEEMTGGSEQQLRQTAETAATMNELASGVQQIAQNAQSVSETATGAIEKAAAGNESIRQAVEQMESIQTNFNGLSGAIQGLGQRSHEIGQIIDSITAIAAQTNLLALNAAIEAARAGEQGRGFAVVADEVRKLAEESAQSARQIGGLILSIQSETNQAVESMESAASEVEEGIRTVHDAGNSFAHITSAIGDVTSQIQEVSAAVEQMAAGTSQVVSSINQVNSISESAASNTENVSAASEEQMASMEEIASSARALAEMAAQLQEMTREFKA